ncbi:hypothetical protein [Avibacterium paragallinarum]|uniref:Uncharacterized protein n=1 Tax=Avibacterium paragallinarum TaxID=728 RepID=A0A8B3TJQ8_AVIPA|nr:hypothetical protein [Avibacterium paragallinarum]RZN60792.1 hypothetical protein EIG79_02570 [Avibacterium paragallinarum]
MELLPIIVLILAWYLVAKFYKNKGHKIIVRHLAGFTVGVLGLIITILIITPNHDVTNNTKSNQESVKSESIRSEEQLDTAYKSSTEQTNSEKEPVAIEDKQIVQTKNNSSDQLDSGLTKQQAEQTLDLNITQFTTRLNKVLKNAQSPFKMTKKPKVTEGEVNDIVQYMFNDNFGVIITLDKSTHKVKSLMTIVTPVADNSEVNLLMLFSNGAVLSAFEGENEIKTLGKQIIELTMSAMKEYGNTKQDISKDFIYNGKKYGISISSYTGIMSFAQFNE